MCTVGVSLYSSTASHPLSLFTLIPPTGGVYITSLALISDRFR